AGGFLAGDLPRPGILPGRLVEMPVDADEAVSAHEAIIVDLRIRFPAAWYNGNKREVAMKNSIVLVSLLCLSGCRAAGDFSARGRDELASEIVSAWTAASKLAAERAIARYGPPDAVSPDALGWTKRGPWKRVIVWNGTGAAVEETISYKIPERRRPAPEA